MTQFFIQIIGIRIFFESQFFFRNVKHNPNFRNDCKSLDFAIIRFGYQSLNKIAPIKTGIASPK